MVMEKIMKGQIGKTKVQILDDGLTNAGVYVWQKANGKFFTDGDNNVLNIPSMRDDQSKIAELAKAAAYYGEPDGKAVFFEGSARITDEEYSVQKDRMAQGYIPSENDLGAMIAAKKTQEMYGNDEQ